MKLLDKDLESLKIFCDSHLLVLSKPAGLLTQPSGTDRVSLEAFGKSWIKKKFNKPGNVFLEAIHRLDKPVSGIVVFARTSKALTRLQEAGRKGLFHKEYLACVEGKFEESEGELEHWLLHRSHRAEVSFEKNPEAKRALLHYAVLGTFASGQRTYSLLKIRLLTGRYHQIRVQLGKEGHPIVGDSKYGSSDAAPCLMLHHYHFEAPHPVTKELLSWKLLPPDIWGKHFPELLNFYQSII